MLWGAVLLDVKQHATRLDMVAGLVHEAAHQLLFGLSVNEQLVENPIEERYGSPLRTDLRRWTAFITPPSCAPHALRVRAAQEFRGKIS